MTSLTQALKDEVFNVFNLEEAFAEGGFCKKLVEKVSNAASAKNKFFLMDGTGTEPPERNAIRELNARPRQIT